MKKIIIKEKTETIPWEVIRKTLIAAHESNFAQGLVVRSTTMTAEQLASQVHDGKCFIAFDEENVVGIAAVRIKDCNRWFCHGKVAHFLLDAVLPNYQGLGIYSELQKKRYQFVENNAIDIITTNTAETNKRMVTMLSTHGFHRGTLFKVADTDHFSITWVKWLKNKPSAILCQYYYLRSVLSTKIRYYTYLLLHK